VGLAINHTSVLGVGGWLNDLIAVSASEAVLVVNTLAILNFLVEVHGLLALFALGRRCKSSAHIFEY